MLDGIVIDDTGVFNDKLREWEDYYNYHRPHGALDGQTPTNASSRKPRPRCNHPPADAQRHPDQPRGPVPRRYGASGLGRLKGCLSPLASRRIRAERVGARAVACAVRRLRAARGAPPAPAAASLG
ncbi:hypothetical protein Airi02_016820 [Actinoallomurus iriomotensis]|uniref:Integrase catalytic domain-containing protein n=1 Tax=Actinoallomurus iriomotensis TaxID=478107 RepID=A0A9W6VSU8_9ACTN|nr:hypothetical protein Airi02_016820 [Actinoallomurus iriomotensis]